MKKRFGLVLVSMMVSLVLIAQTHIIIDNPATWTGEALRPYINQTVIFDVPMIVCGNANGNYTVSPWRKFQPESHGFIGTPDYNETVRINNNCMFSLSGVPSPTSAMDEPSHRCGEKIIGLKAKVNSTSSLTWQGGSWSGNTRADLKKGLPELGDYRLLVCGFNLENYYITTGSMGPRDAEERKAQRKKVSAALKQINADIFGLVELQQGNDAIDEIVNDLNKNIPGRHYTHFNDPASVTFQKVDFVYDANIVEPWGPPNLDNTEVQNRHKMVGFRELATGEQFIYSINHFKAMNSSGDEYRRVNEAVAVIKQYNDYQTPREKDVLFMGDLNCYAFTEPIKQFTAKGFIDLHRAFHADSSYSYMFGGLASYIDHAIGNNSLYMQVTGMAAYHINSDEDDRYNYQKSSDQTMFRCSDHDPVLVGLKLDSTLNVDPVMSINSADIVYEHLHTLTIRNAYREDSPSYYRIYSLRGDLIEQQAITSLFQEVQLPEASDLYILYIYFDKQVFQHKFIVP